MSLGRLLIVIATALGLAACNGLSAGPGKGDGDGDGIEVRLPARFAAVPNQPRIVQGRILAEDGCPRAGATILATGFQTGQPAALATSAVDGSWTLNGLRDANVLLQVDAPGHYRELLPLALQGAEAVVDAGDLILVARQDGRTRLLLAGDTMFGRRFEDHDEDGISGEPEDLITAADRGGDAERLFRYLRSTISLADWRLVNFESPVSLPDTPLHPYKRYSFTSHPDTIPALAAIGIEAVSLGNNHSYDALEPGMAETLAAFQAAGVAITGAASGTETAARAATLAVDLGGGTPLPLLFQGFNGILPNAFETPPPTGEEWRYRYSAAGDGSPGSQSKGGPLWLSNENIDDYLDRNAGRWHLPVLHGGHEYGEYPSANMRSKFLRLLGSGGAEVPLITAHHSHTVYGVGVHRHADGAGTRERAVLCSLGNFLFDQDVFETFTSVIALVDLEDDGAGTPRLHRIQLVPFHQEDYVPSLVAGAQARWMARHLAHLSTFLSHGLYGNPDDGLLGAVCFPDAGGIAVCVRSEDYAWTALGDLAVETALTAGDSAPFPLLSSAAPEAFVRTWSSGPAGSTLLLGRDLLIHGGMEDDDVDADRFEAALWFQDEQRHASPDAARSGRAGIAAVLAADRSTPTGIHFRNRLTVDDGANLEFCCHLQGSNIGGASLEVTWILRDSRDEMGTVLLPLLGAGDHSWTACGVRFSPPPGAGHCRLGVILAAPPSGATTLLLDDAALIAWEHTIAPGEDLVPADVRSIGSGPLPHGFDWARLDGADPTASSAALRFTRVRFHRAPAPGGICGEEQGTLSP